MLLDPPAKTSVARSIQFQISMFVFPGTIQSQTWTERPTIQKQIPHAMGDVEASALAWLTRCGVAQVQLFQNGLFFRLM